jgi:hypothetical protein
MKYGYARVSPGGKSESVDAQARQLTKAGCKKVFRDVQATQTVSSSVPLPDSAQRLQQRMASNKAPADRPVHRTDKRRRHEGRRSRSTRVQRSALGTTARHGQAAVSECRYFFAAPITSEDGKALPCPARLMYSSFVTGCSKETFWSQGTGIPLSRRLA